MHSAKEALFGLSRQTVLGIGLMALVTLFVIWIIQHQVPVLDANAAAQCVGKYHAARTPAESALVDRYVGARPRGQDAALTCGALRRIGRLKIPERSR